jgi:hypothetical protein
MAHANRRVKTREELVGVDLKLNIEEARTLLAITARIGGPPEGRRGHMDDIRVALTTALVPGANRFDSDPAIIKARDFRLSGHLHFSDKL